MNGSPSRYDLPLDSALPQAHREPGPVETSQLAFEPLLLGNAAWYCRLRWGVIAILVVFGIASFCPFLTTLANFKDRVWWPFILAGVLLVANGLFLVQIRMFKKAEKGISDKIRLNLWTQIVFDLLIVSIIVHLAGSVETYVPFLYLFHIVLSCIFLPRRRSLIVALLASVLYTGCVLLEVLGLLPESTLFADGALRSAFTRIQGFPLIDLGSVMAVFIVVWMLTSRLSFLLARREFDLMETNQRLVAVQKEKMRFMLQTTHELKAPFAAIQANTQLLLKGYCGTVEPEAREVIQRIDDRSHHLAGMIHEMLQLANLRSQSDGPLRKTVVDLSIALQKSLDMVRQIAEEHRISLRIDVCPLKTSGVEEHLKILFINLLKNAVHYSHAGSEVRVRCCTLPDTGPQTWLAIEDSGIGIPAEKLPKIFDEYYRTNEALEHNKDSTGLGLTIVRHIAQTHGIRIRVESEVNAGTVFYLCFPPEAPLKA